MYKNNLSIHTLASTARLPVFLPGKVCDSIGQPGIAHQNRNVRLTSEPALSPNSRLLSVMCFGEHPRLTGGCRMHVTCILHWVFSHLDQRPDLPYAKGSEEYASCLPEFYPSNTPGSLSGHIVHDHDLLENDSLTLPRAPSEPF